MSTSVAYALIDVPLDVVNNGKVPIDGTVGVQIDGVYYTPAGAALPPVPVGADVLLFIGGNEGIQVSTQFAGFDFPCGHGDGLFYQNRVALAAGTKLRLLVSYGGIKSAN